MKPRLKNICRNPNPYKPPKTSVAEAKIKSKTGKSHLSFRRRTTPYPLTKGRSPLAAGLRSPTQECKHHCGYAAVQARVLADASWSAARVQGCGRAKGWTTPGRVRTTAAAATYLLHCTPLLLCQLVFASRWSQLVRGSRLLSNRLTPSA